MKAIMLIFLLAVLLFFAAVELQQTSAEAINRAEAKLLNVDWLRNFASVIDALASLARWMVNVWYSA